MADANALGRSNPGRGRSPLRQARRPCPRRALADGHERSPAVNHGSTVSVTEERRLDRPLLHVGGALGHTWGMVHRTIAGTSGLSRTPGSCHLPRQMFGASGLLRAGFFLTRKWYRSADRLQSVWLASCSQPAPGQCGAVRLRLVQGTGPVPQSPGSRAAADRAGPRPAAQAQRPGQAWSQPPTASRYARPQRQTPPRRPPAPPRLAARGVPPDQRPRSLPTANSRSTSTVLSCRPRSALS